MELIFLNNKEIDRVLWDKGISSSLNPMVFAESWYLDICSPGWSAIVDVDYDLLFPVPLNRSVVLPLVMQPLFIQQLGIFSKHIPDPVVLKNVLHLLPYPVGNLNGNSSMLVGFTKQFTEGLHNFPAKCSIKGFISIARTSVSQKGNCILSLTSSYKQLAENYSDNCRRNLKTSQLRSSSIETCSSSKQFIDFTKKHLNYSTSGKALNILKELVNGALQRNCGFIISCNNNDGEPLAMAFFLNKYGLLTFLSGTSSQQGFEHRSMFSIIDHVIRKYAGTDVVLDFEGSNISGVKRFYEGFGAHIEYYPTYENRLLLKIWELLRRVKKISQITS